VSRATEKRRARATTGTHLFIVEIRRKPIPEICRRLAISNQTMTKNTRGKNRREGGRGGLKRCCCFLILHY